MTIKSSFGSVNLDVNPQAHPSATVLEPETPFHILLLGDFSGRPSTSWKPVEIDRDNFEEVLERVAPAFAGMRFRELDDFHPDRIYQQHQLFQGLREVRRKLEAPATFAEAAAEIRTWTQEQKPVPVVRREPPAKTQRPPAPDLAPGGSLLDAMAPVVPRAARGAAEAGSTGDVRRSSRRDPHLEPGTETCSR